MADCDILFEDGTELSHLSDSNMIQKENVIFCNVSTRTTNFRRTNFYMLHHKSAPFRTHFLICELSFICDVSYSFNGENNVALE